jgi:uncharacterized membrane protein YqaE (UPF0057 family)
MAQMSAYTEMADHPWGRTVLRCGRAALVDALLTLAVWAGAIRLLGWRARLKPWVLLPTMALVGAALAVAMESVALALGAWSYSDRMPRVPFFDVGLWPVLQMTILPPLAVALGGGLGTCPERTRSGPSQLK